MRKILHDTRTLNLPFRGSEKLPLPALSEEELAKKREDESEEDRRETAALYRRPSAADLRAYRQRHSRH
ncbi:MAG: hypothetical protein Q7K39_01910 [Candidatus Magasanikbacteria bacterium]|nr:hypothetical protein [Candidatus Magasanikbacteria bacterium]